MHYLKYENIKFSLKMRSIFLGALVFLGVFGAQPVLSQWVEDGTFLSGGNVSELEMVRSSDGYFIAAEILYSTTIKLQCVDAVGQMQWGNVEFSVSEGSFVNLELVPDLEGGVMVVYTTFWDDVYSGDITEMLYVKKFDRNGIEISSDLFDTLTYFSSNFGGYHNLQAAENGTGGAVLVVVRVEQGGSLYMSAGRINSLGSGYMTNLYAGVTQDPESVVLASDGLGSSVIAFENSSSQVAVSRLDYYGNTMWGFNGVVVSTVGLPASEVSMIPWGSGVALAWKELRTDRTVPDGDIMFARVTQDGAVFGTVDAADASTTDCEKPNIMSDFSGRYAVAWQTTSGHIYWDFYINSFLNLINTSIGQSAVGGAKIIGMNYNSPYSYLHRDITVLYTGYGMGGAPSLMTSKYLKKSNQGTGIWSGVPISGSRNSSFPAVVKDDENGWVMAWSEYVGPPFGNRVLAQHLSKGGFWGSPGATAVSAADVPEDQGGYVNLTWTDSRIENSENYYDEVWEYSLWRSIAESQAKSQILAGATIVTDWTTEDKSSSSGLLKAAVQGDKTIYWEYVTSEYPNPNQGHANLMPTIYDSMGPGEGIHQFQIVTHVTSTSYDYEEAFPSAPVSGFSVDNLSPAAPQQPQAAQSYNPVGLTLGWSANTEMDVASYVVHAGLTPDFTPDMNTLVVATADTTAFLSNRVWGTEYFKVAAQDIHQNVGEFSSFPAGSISAADIPANRTLSMTAYPNPFNPMTKISYSVPQSGHVRVQVFNTKGHLVRTLVEGTMDSGVYDATWQGKDTQGKGVSSGVYFLKLENEGMTIKRQITLVR